MIEATSPARSIAATDAPRWGLGDVVLGFFGAEILAAVAYLLAAAGTHYAIGGATGPGAAFGQVVGHVASGQAPAYQAPMPLSFTAVLQIPLWVGLLGVPIWATRTKGNGPVRDLGLRARWVDLPIGAAIGVAAQFALVPLVYWPIFQLFGEQDVSAAARQLTDRATDPFAIVMLFLIVGVGAPFAEEVFFRGLTQRSLDRRFGSVVALVGTAVFFALTHFEPLQFPALVAFALILGMAATRTGRLGMSIAAHVTFNVSAVIVSVWAFDLTPLMVVVSGLLGVVAVTALVLMTRVGTAGAPGDPSALPSDDTMNGTWPTP